jgi:single-strand DNA-binding protein
MSASPTTIVGNITADPELKFLNNGTPKTEFSVAVSHYWTDASGTKQEKTSFFDVIAWRYLAEDVARVLQKGVRVVVTGRLEQRSWEDEKTGGKRSKVELIADEVAVASKSIESFERRRPNQDGNGQSAKRSSRPIAQNARNTRVAVIEEEDEPF